MPRRPAVSTLVIRLVLALVVVPPSLCAAAQDPSHSSSDEDACRPDVFRLCATQIPDEDAIVACLRAEIAKLTPACRAVIGPELSQAQRRVPRS